MSSDNGDRFRIGRPKSGDMLIWDGREWVNKPTADIGLTTKSYVDTQIAGVGGSGSSLLSIPSASLSMNAANQAFLKSGYAHSRAAKAAVVAGTGSMKILVLGDSTTAGAGALGYTNIATKDKALSPACVLAQLLNNTGLPSQSDNFMGDAWVRKNVSGTLYAVYDQRYTAGSANWIQNTNTLGGEILKNQVDQTVSSWLPYNPVDTFEVYYAKNLTTGTFNLSRTGDATSGTIDTSGAAGAAKYVFSGALGSANALKITPVANGAAGLFIIGIDAYNSAVPCIRVIGAGQCGGILSDFVVATNPYDYLPMVKMLAPDLVLIQPGINDVTSSTAIGNASTPGTYLGDLQTLINACQLSGDVIFTTHYPSQITVPNGSLASQETYVNALLGLATANNIAVNDLWHKWQSYESMSALSGGDASTTLASAPNSWYSGPSGTVKHPSANGYRSKAQADASIILSI